MSRPLKDYYNFGDLPKAEEDSEFWRIIGNPEYKKTAVLLILNNIRLSRSEDLSDAACRSKLAKIEQLVELVDLPNFIISLEKGIDISEEELDIK